MISHPTAARSISQLPQPDDDALAVSDQLCAVIDSQILENHGLLPFADFMHLALYSPGLGYYTAGSRKFGRDGDFVTAPELGRGFGCCLARQIREIFELTGTHIILECGAGTGVLAAQILAELHDLNALPDTYFILEVSADLKQRQQHTIKREVPELYPRVRWLSQLPESINGVVVANELLDAMPVSRFKVTQSGITTEVTRNAQHREASGARYESAFVPADDCPWQPSVAALDLAEGFYSEVNDQAQAWVTSVAERLECGALLIVDYGFPQHEFYHPQRSMGTLMCHYRHHAHADPYQLVGLQDITAHVDFTAVAQCCDTAGLTINGYTQQAPFLMALGLVEHAQSALIEGDAASVRLATEIKLLTLPSEMGELFKVLIAGRGINKPLTGFALKNDIGRL